MYYYFYQAAMILSLIIAFFTIVMIWPYRNFFGAKSMFALLIAIFVWTLGFLLEANSETLEMQLLFTSIGYLGSMSVPIAWFVFSLNYSNNKRVIFGFRTYLLSIIPLITVILVWTNPLHHLMWYNEHLSTFGEFTITVKTYGVFFWISLGYNYLLIFLGGIILLRRLFVGKRLYRKQSAAIITAVLLPWIWNIIYIFNLAPLVRKDMTPIMFTISCVVLTMALLRFQMFTIIPFAHEFVIKHLNDGIFAFNKNNRLVDANPAGLKMIQLNEDIIGKRLENIAKISPLFEKLSPAHFGYAGSPVILPDQDRICELETAPMFNDERKLVGWLAILRDITEHKKAEEQAHEAEALKKLDRLRTELLANVSHELRTPLASIKGFASTLLRTDIKWNDEEQRDFLKTIDEEADRLNNIIGDILDMSRIDTGDLKLNLAIHHVAELLVSILERLKPLTVNHQLVVKIPAKLPLVYADDMRIGQVLSNLVDNAVKYSVEGSEITVEAQLSGDKIIVSVSDQGAGISPEALSKLFDRFYQVDRIVRGQKKGTGLGLSICRGIIQAHGGKIWVESTVGKGSTFSFSLPLGPPVLKS